MSEAIILPTIDGDVINDKAWEGLSTIKTFTQKSPDEGNLSTEKTIVKIIFRTDFLCFCSLLRF